MGRRRPFITLIIPLSPSYLEGANEGIMGPLAAEIEIGFEEIVDGK
jgi:hypothetical protein